MGKTFRSYADTRRIQFLITIISAFLIFSDYPGFSQVKEPVIPAVSDIEVPDQQFEKFRSQVTVYGSGTIKGELRIAAGQTVTSAEGRIYPFSEISKIRIQKWSMKKEGGNILFYPCLYEINLKNGTGFTVNGNIVSLNRLTLAMEKKNRAVYTYFYDYFKKGKWVNSGLTGSGKDTETPAKGTVYIIELN